MLRIILFHLLWIFRAFITLDILKYVSLEKKYILCSPMSESFWDGIIVLLKPKTENVSVLRIHELMEGVNAVPKNTHGQGSWEGFQCSWHFCTFCGHESFVFQSAQVFLNTKGERYFEYALNILKSTNYLGSPWFNFRVLLVPCLERIWGKESLDARSC